MPLKFEAIRFRQGSTTMYLGAIPAGELVRRSTIDRYNPKRVGKWKGYQRNTFDDKVRSMTDYFLRDHVLLPVAGLLNARRKHALGFRLRNGSNPAVGTATLQDDQELFVVDMQHRLEGANKAIEKKPELARLPLPVVIIEGLDRVDEAVQFYIVNTKAKKLGVDLARRLMIEHKRIRDIDDVQPWEIKAVLVAMSIEKLRDSPWFARIQEPNQDRTREHICTEKGFVPTLRRLLKRPEYAGMSVRELTRSLVAYWKAIERVFPEAFREPRRYVIQKVGPGVSAMHRVAPILFDHLRRKRRAVGEDNIFDVLKSLQSLGSRFWEGKNRRGAKRFGTGEEAFSLLADYLCEKMGIKSRS